MEDVRLNVTDLFSSDSYEAVKADTL